MLIEKAVKNGSKSIINVNFPRKEIKGVEVASIIDKNSFYTFDQKWTVDGDT